MMMKIYCQVVSFNCSSDNFGIHNARRVFGHCSGNVLSLVVSNFIGSLPNCSIFHVLRANPVSHYVHRPICIVITDVVVKVVRFNNW